MRYRNGTFESLTDAHPAVADYIRAVTVGPNSTVWAAPEEAIARYHNGTITSLTPENGFPSARPHAIYESPDGDLWTGTYGDGLTHARTHTPDCIVSDVMMPVMDGVAMLRAIRETPSTDFIPVVLLTARAFVHLSNSGCDCASGFSPSRLQPRLTLSRIRLLCWPISARPFTIALAIRSSLCRRLPRPLV